MDYQSIIDMQTKLFNSGVTRSISWRKQALLRLKQEVLARETELCNALYTDLGKSAKDSYMTEIGLVISEINYSLKHLSRWVKVKRVPTPLYMTARSYIVPEPYGRVLIMSPWNYPVMLTLCPLVGVLSAGNTAVIKPSNYSPATSNVIRQLLTACFSPDYVAVTTGGRDVNAQLLDCKWDYIFFTGGKDVGKLVMQKAVQYLTPVTLELGGKSPCIVDSSADIDLSAKSIMFGKLINAGQTCVAPDYCLVHSGVKDRLIESMKGYINHFYGDNALDNANYGKIVNAKHFDRLNRMIDASKVVYGGLCDSTALKIQPTLLDNVTLDDKCMSEEIFGPILPIITFDNFDDIYNIIDVNTHPLALYIYSNDKTHIRQVISTVPFGGGCVNDSLIHVSSPYLPFGGVGQSGMGSYHGKASYDLFTHHKSIVQRLGKMDLPFRYADHNNTRIIKMFVK
ncbi:MAG: aldehyde dehydrogenase [Clostridia bacterium]|nr:aldehyde dehydrogenase [Clostridia bacterium]